MAPGDPSWRGSQAKDALCKGLKSNIVKDDWTVDDLLKWNPDLFLPFARNDRLKSNLRANWLRLSKQVDRRKEAATKDKARVVAFKELVGVPTHDHKGKLLWSDDARKQMREDMNNATKKDMKPATLQTTSYVYKHYDAATIRRQREQEIFQRKSNKYWDGKEAERVKRLKKHKV